MKTSINIALIVMLTTFFFSSQNVHAQKTNRELGIRFSGLSDFNFVYKKQLNENRYLRLRTGAFNINVNSQANSLNSGFVIGIGFENRKSIDDKLSFIHGFEPSLATNLTSQNSNSRFNTQIFAGYVLGFHLNLSESFGINMETIPAFTANYSSGNDDGNLGFGLGFNSNAISLTMVYRFMK